MKKFTNVNWINECKESILIAFPSIGQEYIDEAEHQDGFGYWANFETVSQVLKDVQLYSSYTPKEALRVELHKRLDQMVDHLEFDGGDQVTEIAELLLRSNNRVEQVLLSRDFGVAGDPIFFAEFYEQYSYSYEFNVEEQSRNITEVPLMYYHDDGTKYTIEELKEADIENLGNIRDWKRLHF